MIQEKCSQCASPFVHGDAFCPSCGAVLRSSPPRVRCTFCNTVLERHDTFCSACGQATGVSVPHHASAIPLAVPRATSPKAAPMVNSGSALPGPSQIVPASTSSKSQRLAYLVAAVMAMLGIFGLTAIYAYRNHSSPSAVIPLSSTPRIMPSVQSAPQSRQQPVYQRQVQVNAPPTAIECDECHGRGKCHWCNGTGKDWNRNTLGYYKDCMSCKGTGWCQKCGGAGQLVRRVCGNCNDAGQIPHRTCWACHGSGKSHVEDVMAGQYSPCMVCGGTGDEGGTCRMCGGLGYQYEKP